jgi:hypothetical protein
MDKNWKTENLPLNKKLTLWIKSKIEKTSKGMIVIEIKDSKIVSVHYNTSGYILDVDNPEKN